MSKVPKKGSLLSFCNILRKSIVTVFAFYWDEKHSDTRSQSCLLLLVFANISTVSILPGQSQFVISCPSVPDWIDLYWFLYFSPKNFSYFQNPTFIVNYIYSNSYLECYKNITVLSSTKMLFWKHSIRTFECYFERHTFDFIASSGKLVQKLSSEQSFLKTLKQKVNSLDSWSIISEFINGNKNEKIVFLL